MRSHDEVLIVQTKCWSRYKRIPESHVFQLYGTMTHFKLVSNFKCRRTRAVFDTTAQYSEVARRVAQVLGVELRTEVLDRSYPKVKCVVSRNGEKIYHLPFDPSYDRVKIEPRKGDFYAQTVQEAVEEGFRRARDYDSAA